MNDPSLARRRSIALRHLLGPPPSTPPTIDWSAVEHRLGFTPPPDYRAWANVYPQITIDGFLTVLHPAGPPSLNLFTADTELLSFERQLRDSDPGDMPYPIQPEPGGLYPWGWTANSDRLHWYPAGGRLVVINRFGNHEWPGTMADFLIAFLARAPLFPFFPADYPRPGFTVDVAD
ncbi:hypothetical protein ACFVAV_23540 [Nocardia sp. NPDC057663]|uniref:hypothetical protein n=1 Tax=Nocardia sp. NPDC057663 TaxID=3346201 RepID=UPI00366E696A